MPKKTPAAKPVAKKAAKKLGPPKRPDEFEVLRRLHAAAEAPRLSPSLLQDSSLLDAEDLRITAYEEAGSASEALERLNAALDANPASIDALTALSYEADVLPQIRVAALTFIVSIAQRALGRTLDKHRGDLWSHLPARPFIRAKLALAMTCMQMDDKVGALAEFEEVLGLDTSDHHGVRHHVVPLLMSMGEYDRAMDVMEFYREDNGALFAWCRFALSFVYEDADGVQALADARASNRHVEGLLRNPDPGKWNAAPPPHKPGSLDEAKHNIEQIFSAWVGVPEAFDWLMHE